MKNNRQFIAAMLSALGLLAGNVSAEEAYSGAWYAVPGVSLMDTDKDLAAKTAAARPYAWARNSARIGTYSLVSATRVLTMI